jgi:hypothetical protein
MHGHNDAAGEPHASIRGEVERLVGNTHMHRLVLGEAGARQRIAHRPHFIKKLCVAKAGEGLARGEALRSPGEERSEIQARREIEKVGGWRSDCATTQ